jgi:hypothetical protein
VRVNARRSRLRSLLSPPAIEVPEGRRLARILYPITLCILGLMAALALAHPSVAPEPQAAIERVPTDTRRSERAAIDATRVVEAGRTLLETRAREQAAVAELAQRMKHVHPEARVLYVSGYADDALGRRGVDPGDEAFPAKPFTPDALARRVREILDAPGRS